jgi:hypothetical protein
VMGQELDLRSFNPKTRLEKSKIQPYVCLFMKQ